MLLDMFDDYRSCLIIYFGNRLISLYFFEKLNLLRMLIYIYGIFFRIISYV